MRLKKDYYVLFNKYGARLYKNPEKPELLYSKGIVFHRPDLKYVRGISPSFWTLKNGKIFPMDEKERKKVMVKTKKQSFKRRLGIVPWHHPKSLLKYAFIIISLTAWGIVFYPYIDKMLN